jgi:hypothetical protein
MSVWMSEKLARQRAMPLICAQILAIRKGSSDDQSRRRSWARGKVHSTPWFAKSYSSLAGEIGYGCRMAALDNVRALIIRLSPEPICDDCVAERLNLSVRQLANQHTRELAGMNGFERRKDICSLCFGEKLVIRRPR